MDLKYYGGKQENLVEMLETLEKLATEFFVAGRLMKDKFEGLNDESMSIVPEPYRHMFKALEDFRQDISSSELRAKGITL